MDELNQEVEDARRATTDSLITFVIVISVMFVAVFLFLFQLSETPNGGVVPSCANPVAIGSQTLTRDHGTTTLVVVPIQTICEVPS